MPSDSTPEEVLDPLDATLDLSFDQDGAEWEHYLAERLRERLGDTSMYNEWHGPPEVDTVYYDFRVADPPVASWLRLFIDQGAARAFLVTPNSEAIADERQLWLDAVRVATSRVGSERPEFQWFSLIASEPLMGAPQVLEKGVIVGGMTLIPTGRAYWEYKPDRATLDGTGLSWSSLVEVEGTDVGFNYDAAQLKGARRIATLRALMSVILEERWVIKHSPLDHKIRLPSNHPLVGPRDHPPDLSGHAHTPVNLPSWVEAAWKRVSAQEDLSGALAMYQEGLDLWDDHPSLSLVCLVALIETIGARYQPLVRCDCCEQCKVDTGAGKRFRAALNLVMTEEESRPLRRAYGPRSETVHSGRLHGAEMEAGAWGLGLTQPDPRSDFRLDLVDELRDASRQILTLALRGELPESSAG